MLNVCMNMDARTRSPQQQEVPRQTAILHSDQGKRFVKLANT